MEIRETRIMGGVGAILTLLGFVPYIGWILSIVGLILLYLAIKKLSEVYARSEILSDFTKALALMIISVIIFLFAGGKTLSGIISILRSGGAFRFGLAAILFIIGWIVSIVASYFYYQSLKKLGESSKISNFNTAGLLIFIGYILVIVFVGSIVVLIGKIFEIISFFSLPESV